MTPATPGFPALLQEFFQQTAVGQVGQQGALAHPRLAAQDEDPARIREHVGHEPVEHCTLVTTSEQLSHGRTPWVWPYWQSPSRGRRVARPRRAAASADRNTTFRSE